MRVVYIVSVWPEPQTSGASVRVLQLIDFLKCSGAEILVASTASRTPLSADLEAQGIETSLIELNDSCFDEFIKHQNPDLVIFDRFMTEEKFGWRVAEHCPQAIRVLDTIELHSLRAARVEQIKKNNHKLNLQNPTSLREIASIYRCDVSLFVSDYEIELITKHFNVPSELMHYHPLTYDEGNQNATSLFEERADFIAIGSFLHPPNWDQVLKLKNDLWPAIRKALPGAQLNIVGSYPPQKAIALHNPKQGFIMKGFVENDFETMQQARVHLAPLRFGAGIKSKCLLAFKAGTPTVTTAVGAEGLKPSDNWAGSICLDDADFIDSAIKYYQSESEFARAQENCAMILADFNTTNWYPKLEKKLATIAGNLEQHRQANFTGKMLLHHQHLSTRYMSKWIEEKNANITV